VAESIRREGDVKSKVMFLVGGAVGYVLGTRAGRQRYDELKARAGEVLHSPKVQDAVAKAQAPIKQKAPTLSEAASDLVRGPEGSSEGPSGGPPEGLSSVRSQEPTDGMGDNP
jgi:hypothetical protein